MLPHWVLLIFGSIALARVIVHDESAHNSTSDRTPRIIHGHIADDNKYPYVVSLSYVGRVSGHACGASIINKNWLLTAAHCCLTGHLMNVFAGSIYLSRGGQTYHIEKYSVHGDYNPDNYWRNDICLVKTTEDIQYSDNVQPVILPSRSHTINTGDILTIVGWGNTANGGRTSDVLQVLDNYTALANDDCKERTHIAVHERQLCAEGGSGQANGVCYGDSGGPLTLNGVLVGVASFVLLPCGGAIPDIYTRVTPYLDWIVKVIASG